MTLQETINEVFAKHDAECLLLTKQRDEARKTCCGLWEKEDSGYITKKQLAADQGWDCYKEETQ